MTDVDSVIRDVFMTAIRSTTRKGASTVGSETSLFSTALVEIISDACAGLAKPPFEKRPESRDAGGDSDGVIFCCEPVD